jgi:hypothetical protein
MADRHACLHRPTPYNTSDLHLYIGVQVADDVEPNSGRRGRGFESRHPDSGEGDLCSRKARTGSPSNYVGGRASQAPHERRSRLTIQPGWALKIKDQRSTAMRGGLRRMGDGLGFN